MQSIESRLLEDNRNLSKERAQLSDLMKNLQTMQSEVERNGESEKRRLESQVQFSETQM
jgi:nucleoprotein TPR